MVIDPQIVSFAQFSPEHLSTLVLIATLGVCLFLFRQTLFMHPFFRYLLAIILITGEVGYQIGMIAAGKWSLRGALPLQVSDMAALIAAMMLLTRSRKIAEVLYFIGIGSAVHALVTPDLGTAPLHILQFFATHGATVLACLYMVAAERVHPPYRVLWLSALIVTLYGVLIFAVDRFLEANYLYLMHKPAVSVLNWLGPWPWYLIWVEVMMLGEFHLLYWLIRRKTDEPRRNEP
ncbi:TIGR02206 family membrane protein [Sporolactobacillus sp. CPB3-1]|uniref:TIGR02206 family membrane protein n=1 Tax=Sporolactobacillus mangiferae TaxID=2940498 RepID=A0ABT0M8J3_9BACL|nr:TIGR02206 family membrane protein [Sporolactobacillus mangiferae]MCL1631194.1 TIGR02206 family membrane protein [Sporolactobacillus mangiferae]